MMRNAELRDDLLCSVRRRSWLLAVHGYVEVDRSETAVVFQTESAKRVSLHPPNHAGHVPETLINDAFDVAGLTPPAWDVFWCD